MTTLCVLAITSLLAAQPAMPQTEERAEAERLARTGSYAEALQRFRAMAAAHPDDLEARVWIGRLQQWTGHADRAVDVFRSVLAASPDRVDALIGLGAALAELDRPDEAVATLDKAEKLAPDNVDLLAAQGHAHHIAGRARLALAYYRRAALLRPADPAIRLAYEDVQRDYGNRVSVDSFFESFSGATPNSWSGSAEVNMRIGDALRAFARGQQQRKFGETDVRGGGGLEWRVSYRWTLRGHALFSPDASVLPQVDGGAEASYTYRRVTYSASAQYVDFDLARAWIVAPGLTVPVAERFTIIARYVSSATEFASSGEWTDKSSGSVGVRTRLLDRLWVDVAYASGIENFDTLSTDRLGDFSANTFRGSARIELPSLTSVAATYEMQWREHDARMHRVTAGLVQRF
jgi:YaiO family outer membrane protein